MQNDLLSGINFEIIEKIYVEISQKSSIDLTKTEKKELLKLLGRFINLKNLIQLSNLIRLEKRISEFEKEMKEMKKLVNILKGE